jgi:hypothetical protein
MSLPTQGAGRQVLPQAADALTVSEALVERHAIAPAPCHESSQSALATIESPVGCNEQPIVAGGQCVQQSEQLAVRRVPESQNSVVRGRDDAIAVGTPRNLRGL